MGTCPVCGLNDPTRSTEQIQLDHSNEALVRVKKAMLTADANPKPDNFPTKETLDDLLYAMRTSEVLKLTAFDYRKGFTDAIDIIVKWMESHKAL